MKIYIVSGTSGEYSDRDEWPIAAYTEEELAKEHVLLASRMANEMAISQDWLHRASMKGNRRLTDEEMRRSNEIANSNPYDPETQDWLERHEYYYEAVDLLEELYNK